MNCFYHFILSTKQLLLECRKQTQPIFLGVAPLIFASSVSAASYVVTTTSDLANPPSGTSLRGVLNAINQSATCNSSMGVADISFAITSGSLMSNGVKYYSIQPGLETSGLPLPIIHCPVNIHGPNSDGAAIELDGQYVNATPNPPASFPAGLTFVGRDSASGAKLAQDPSGSTVKNLVMNRFPRNAIYLFGVDKVTIVGNFFGLDVTGELSGYSDGLGAIIGSNSNTEGNEVRIEGSNNNYLGTTSSDYPFKINSANRNVFGQCASDCLGVVPINQSINGFGGPNAIPMTNISSTHNVVQDNYMGINKEGTQIIGGFDIKGNHGSGPNFPYSNAVPFSPYLIFDSVSLVNSASSYAAVSGKNVFGGLLKGQGNVVGGSDYIIILLQDSNSYVLGNTLFNSYVSPIRIEGNNNLVANNNIGMDIHGSCSNPAIMGSSTDTGIWLDSGDSDILTNNVVGKNLMGAIRVASGLTGVPVTNALVANNYIGTDRSLSQTACGNSSPGITVAGDVQNSQIIGNVIANNGSVSGEGGIIMKNLQGFGGAFYGLTVTNPTGISVLSNIIYPSPGIGLDLGAVPYSGFAGLFGPGSLITDITAQIGDGPTLNSMISPVAGQPNGLQNNPVLTNAQISGDDLVVSGTLSSTPSTYYLIQIYEGNPTQCIQLSTALPTGYNTNCPVSGMATFLASSGNQVIGNTIVKTDFNGNAAFKANMEAYVIPGTPIVATATRIDTSSFIPIPRDTSEFSQASLAH